MLKTLDRISTALTWANMLLTLLAIVWLLEFWRTPELYFAIMLIMCEVLLWNEVISGIRILWRHPRYPSLEEEDFVHLRRQLQTPFQTRFEYISLAVILATGVYIFLHGGTEAAVIGAVIFIGHAVNKVLVRLKQRRQDKQYPRK